MKLRFAEKMETLLKAIELYEKVVNKKIKNSDAS